MDSRHLLNTSLINALHTSYPQLKVGVHRVLYQHRHVYTLQAVGQSLHGEGISCCAGTYPQDVHTILQAQLHMLRSSHLGSNEHPRLFLNSLQPWQRFLSVALKTARFGAWFPYACTIYFHSARSKLLGGRHHLFFGFGAAWAGYYYRFLIVETFYCDRFNIFHNQLGVFL